MIVVSDTSPIRALISIGKLQLLAELHEKIIIPEAVREELLSIKSKKEEIKTIFNYDWIEVRKIQNKKLFDDLNQVLDKGESEAITLTKDLNADLLLIDEAKGRKKAMSLGINVVGILGLLIEAKEKGLIPHVKEILDDLRVKGGFWIKEDLYNIVLKRVKEI